MNRLMRIIVLVENTAGGCGLLAEHGLSFWVKTGSRRVLWDTGQGMCLEHNARALGISLASADAIVLSHGHYDHTGGLKQAVTAAPQAAVFAHPDAFRKKYARRDDGTTCYIGVPAPDENCIEQEAGQLVWTNRPTEICDGLFVTGEIPRVTDFEDTGGPFFIDEGCRQADPLSDDQAAFVETPAGTVVILGCAHAGVINTLRHVQTLTNNRSIHAVIGGMHLINASPERMDKTITELHRLDVRRLLPCHCTGFAAVDRLWNEFPGRCAICPAGAVVEFER